jgi:hypothetical protein
VPPDGSSGQLSSLPTLVAFRMINALLELPTPKATTQSKYFQ